MTKASNLKKTRVSIFNLHEFADAWFTDQSRRGQDHDHDHDSVYSGSIGDWGKVPGSSKMTPQEAFDISTKVDRSPLHQFGSLNGDNINKNPKKVAEYTSGRDLENNSAQRRMDDSPYHSKNKVDIDTEFDWWSQGYRLLGAFIDCDQLVYQYCSRWMMWAAYVNPNYEGGGFREYYPNASSGEEVDHSEYNEILDCHQDDTQWELLGVYRMELYQFIEQLSKHVWHIDSWEYQVVIGSLEYMTNQDCSYLGKDKNGNPLYGGVLPMENGYFSMGVFQDDICILEADGYNFDDFERNDENEERENDENGENDDDEEIENDENDDDADPGEERNLIQKRKSKINFNESWKRKRKTEEQEDFTYELTYLNEILDNFKTCRLCLDYPTYQDGYFQGSNGTDDSVIINQCWKFHSHNSYTCTADCILLGHLQGTITNLKYADISFGEPTEDVGSEDSTNSILNSFGVGSHQRAGSFENYFLLTSFAISFITFLFAYGYGHVPDDKNAALIDKQFRADVREEKKKALVQRLREKMKRDEENFEVEARNRIRKATVRSKTMSSIKKLENDIDTRHRKTYIQDDESIFTYA
eukprot:CAMPEP_0194273652 /NCGR_PEP_ID=MMETSP0169-20130528/6953_1 /TAXON_ID=218684 /ORGANISM="Corethron pennatum, Strain L29A3" /LENGTH=583 /DNA_ID=CAMNT_0039016671 /DNA_START=124 /DNA_END=1875 /DNA_ORIENTATION=-